MPHRVIFHKTKISQVHSDVAMQLAFSFLTPKPCIILSKVATTHDFNQPELSLMRSYFCSVFGALSESYFYEVVMSYDMGCYERTT